MQTKSNIAPTSVVYFVKESTLQEAGAVHKKTTEVAKQPWSLILVWSYGSNFLHNLSVF